MKYEFLEQKVLDFSHISFWQSPVWRDLLIHSGQARESFFFGSGSGSWLLVEIRSLGLGQYGAFSLGVSRDQLQSDIGDFFLALESVLKKKGVLFFQIEPLEEIEHFPFAQMKTYSPYRSFLTPYTRTLDLTGTEDEILHQMHEKGRYNIRLAERRGVQVVSVEPSEENMDIWISLLSETTLRDGFSQNARKYYEIFLRSGAGGDTGITTRLYFASFEGRVIAAGIYVFLSDRAIYYYGASSSEKEDRKQMAPYLLQWTAIREAKKRDIPLYDFLGVATPGDSQDPLRGVTDFKEKFGGTCVKLPPKVLIPISRRYHLFSLLRRWFRGKK